ncbi:hypothetical protein O3P69_010018 [Scylla paramamosain]|uniref:Uncharacterized protein n=1 Tax=Scylla paramamosain TaxID=85552 RepID=A0AAW0SN36_SCYPA
MGGVLTEASERCSKDWLSGGAGRPHTGLGTTSLPGLPVEASRPFQPTNAPLNPRTVSLFDFLFTMPQRAHLLTRTFTRWSSNSYNATWELSPKNTRLHTNETTEM